MRSRRRSPASRALIWVVIAAVLLLVAGIALVNAGSLRAAPTVQVQNADNSAWGPANAKVKVVEYANFGCIHCRDFALSQEQQLRTDYQNSEQVRFEFMPFKLSDPAPDEAANAALCAADQGKFWEYHDLLFQKQTAGGDPFSKSALQAYGAQVGLDSAKFSQCVNQDAHMAQVNQDTQSGLAQGVTGTPTFFINGKKVEGAVPYSELKAAVESALKSAS